MTMKTRLCALLSIRQGVVRLRRQLRRLLLVLPPQRNDRWELMRTMAMVTMVKMKTIMEVKSKIKEMDDGRDDDHC